jgi:uncharacterized protein with NAD-binding domain and iron-sulfur cluster
VSGSPSLQRIVIVGAGPSGLATALHLTDPTLNPNWEKRYKVEIYQLGWRAGGKGATGRNENAYERIEEHGIHLFGNMYYNSTRMIQTVLGELEFDPHDRYRTMETVFLPTSASSTTDYYDSRWHQLMAPLVSTKGNPWEGEVDIDNDDIIGSIIERTVKILGWAADAYPPQGGGLTGFIQRLIDSYASARLKQWAKQIKEHEKQERDRDGGRGPSHESAEHRRYHQEVVDQLTDMVRRLERLLRWAPRLEALRACFVQFDLTATLMRGLLADDVINKGIRSIDDINYRDWFIKHGASPITMASSWPQAIPNTALSYENGDTTQIPSMSASCYVMFFLRWVMGTGAGGYMFHEGTGETIIKPMFRLLEQRGVTFHFFHKLTEVEADESGERVAKLRFDVQATPIGGSYDPLRRMADGELVWPNHPLYDQLEEGDALRGSKELSSGGYDLESWWTAWNPVGELTLEADRDFDVVVLATPVDTLRYTCASLTSHNQAFADMVTNVKTAATQSVQLWLDTATRDLGWDGPLHGTDRYLGGVYGQDLTSYCDFSDLVEEERWPAGQVPKGLIYLIGALSDPDEIPPFSDHGYPRRAKERVKWMTVQYLRNIDGLLPGSAHSPIDKRSFDFSMLVAHDPSRADSRGVNRIEQQYYRANIDPNERYTLSVPGSLRYRLPAWGSGFTNLVMAGDWIDTGWNVGSFEGAVMGGKLASLTISGAPTIDLVYGYDFLQIDPAQPPSPLIP